MPIIGLLAVGVSLAIDKYQERQAARNAGIEAQDHTYGLGLSPSPQPLSYTNVPSQETGITSPELEQKREEEAFHELQNYADFQEALSSKVLAELSQDDYVSAPYRPNLKPISHKSAGNRWYDQNKGERYTTQNHLSCPIIISQKASGSDGPGWVRTYSPALMDCDIPQQPFLEFLDSFNDSLHVRAHIYLLMNALTLHM
jgi:hypothetical protein